MDQLLTAVGLAAVTWIVEKTLDALYERWKARRARPLTDAEAHRNRRRRLAMAYINLLIVVAALAWCGLSIVAGERSPAAFLAVAVLLGVTGYLVRVLRRRRRRLQPAPEVRWSAPTRR